VEPACRLRRRSSRGQQGYLGIGGYALVVLADLAGWNPFVCLPIAGRSRRSSRPTSKIVFRLHGGYFAIGTWVVAESFRLIAAKRRSSAAERARA
jgi:branched-chain amino acid transport system permease protein